MHSLILDHLRIGKDMDIQMINEAYVAVIRHHSCAYLSGGAPPQWEVRASRNLTPVAPDN